MKLKMAFVVMLTFVVAGSQARSIPSWAADLTGYLVHDAGAFGISGLQNKATGLLKSAKNKVKETVEKGGKSVTDKVSGAINSIGHDEEEQIDKLLDDIEQAESAREIEKILQRDEIEEDENDEEEQIKEQDEDENDEGENDADAFGISGLQSKATGLLKSAKNKVKETVEKGGKSVTDKVSGAINSIGHDEQEQVDKLLEDIEQAESAREIEKIPLPRDEIEEDENDDEEQIKEQDEDENDEEEEEIGQDENDEEDEIKQIENDDEEDEIEQDENDEEEEEIGQDENDEEDEIEQDENDEEEEEIGQDENDEEDEIQNDENDEEDEIQNDENDEEDEIQNDENDEEDEIEQDENDEGDEIEQDENEEEQDEIEEDENEEVQGRFPAEKRNEIKQDDGKEEIMERDEIEDELKRIMRDYFRKELENNK